MKRFLTTIALLSVVFIPQSLIALDSVDGETQAKETTLEQYILTYTEKFGSDPDVVYSVMMCESRGKWVQGDMRGGVPHSFGQFQFFTETWNRYAKLYRETFGVSDEFDIRSAHDQIKLTSFVFSLSESNKNEWTSYRSINNGGTITLYSKFHKRYFTISCPLIKIPRQ